MLFFAIFITAVILTWVIQEVIINYKNNNIFWVSAYSVAGIFNLVFFVNYINQLFKI